MSLPDHKEPAGLLKPVSGAFRHVRLIGPARLSRIAVATSVIGALLVSLAVGYLYSGFRQSDREVKLRDQESRVAGFGRDESNYLDLIAYMFKSGNRSDFRELLKSLGAKHRSLAGVYLVDASIKEPLRSASSFEFGYDSARRIWGVIGDLAMRECLSADAGMWHYRYEEVAGTLPYMAVHCFTRVDGGADVLLVKILVSAMADKHLLDVKSSGLVTRMAVLPPEIAASFFGNVPGAGVELIERVTRRIMDADWRFDYYDNATGLGIFFGTVTYLSSLLLGLLISATLIGLRGASSRVKVESMKLGRERIMFDRERAMSEAVRIENSATSRVRDIGFWTSGVIHDISNYMTTIMGYGAMLAEGAREGSAEARFGIKIFMVGERINELCASLQDYAADRPSALTTIDISEVARHTLSLLKVAIPKHVKVVLAEDLEPLAVKGERARIQQIIYNLAKNAAEAIGRRSGQVKLRTYHTMLMDCPSVPGTFQCSFSVDPPSRGWAVVEVADNGPGIPASVLQEFGSKHVSTKGDGRGWGVWSIIESLRVHAGAVCFESAVGKGTTVRVYIPLFSEIETVQIHVVPKLWPQIRGLVVVAEEDEFLRGYLREKLQQVGLEVEMALDLLDAADLALKTKAILIIANQSASDPDSTNVCRQLRRRGISVPIIRTGGHGRIPESGSSVDLLYFLRKPYTSDQLMSTVHEALGVAATPAR